MNPLPLALLALALALAAGCGRAAVDAPAGAPVGTAPIEVPPPATFDCAGRAVTVQYGGDDLTLLVEGEPPRVLPRVPSASGAKFARADTSFWTRGDDATLILGGRTIACTIPNDDTPPEGSAEDTAAAAPRFRGVGQEPGWTVDVFADRIAFVGDYGEREVVVPRPEPERRGRRTRYRVSTEANDFVLTIEEEPCRDAMSGAAYPATVVVEVNGDRYRGCGRGTAD